MRHATLPVLGLLVVGLALGAVGAWLWLDSRGAREVDGPRVFDAPSNGAVVDLHAADDPTVPHAEGDHRRGLDRARDDDAAELLAEIEELEAAVRAEDAAGEDEGFDEFFDSATMYEPVKVAGPLTVGTFPDGRMHFRAEQRRFGDEWLRDGTWQVWHANGQPHEEGAYAEGEEHGDWRWWYPDGTPMSHGRYDVGYREGPWTFYHENGRVAVQGQYEAGDGVGHWVHFDQNGTKRAEGDFHLGRPSGNWVAYDEHGRLNEDATGEYLHGIRRR